MKYCVCCDVGYSFTSEVELPGRVSEKYAKTHNATREALLSKVPSDAEKQAYDKGLGNVETTLAKVKKTGGDDKRSTFVVTVDVFGTRDVMVDARNKEEAKDKASKLLHEKIDMTGWDNPRVVALEVDDPFMLFLEESRMVARKAREEAEKIEQRRARAHAKLALDLLNEFKDTQFPCEMPWGKCETVNALFNRLMSMQGDVCANSGCAVNVAENGNFPVRDEAITLIKKGRLKHLSVVEDACGNLAPIVVSA